MILSISYLSSDLSPFLYRYRYSASKYVSIVMITVGISMATLASAQNLVQIYILLKYSLLLTANSMVLNLLIILDKKLSLLCSKKVARNRLKQWRVRGMEP